MQTLILCYHQVGPEQEFGRRLNVEPNRLLSHARYFHRRRYVSATPGNPVFGSARTVCFSFDDAFSSTVQLSPSVLERFDFRGVFYAVSAKAGHSSDWEGGGGLALATFPMLRSLQASGHEIGNHSVSHRYLARLTEAEQRTEVFDAHARLVAEGLNPHSFCYPYGSHDTTTLNTVGDCGYRYGLSLRKLGAERELEPLALPRVVVAFGDALPLLIYKCFVRPKMRRSTRI